MPISVTVNNRTVAPGSLDIAVYGSGWGFGEPISIRLLRPDSTTLDLGTAVANNAGAFCKQIAVFGSALNEAGSYTLLATGIVSGKASTPIIASALLSVPTPPSTPLPILSTVNLQTASNFAILAKTGVSNVGNTNVIGDIGTVSNANTGFPPGVVSGATHIADASVIQGQTDLQTAYNDATARKVKVIDLTNNDLGGMTLTPGIYRFDSSASITGNLVLDAHRNPYNVYVFQIGSQLTTSNNSQIVLLNGASAANIFWQVGTSVTMGSSTVFKGNLLTNGSIELGTGTMLDGRALSLNGAISLDNNIITKP